MDLLTRILMVAGEASGDLHGSDVVREIRRHGAEVEVCGIGGVRMAEEGVRLIRRVEDMAFMGFSEVVRHLPSIWGVLHEIEEVLDRARPDLVILIDYPGFNLRVARMAKERGIPVLYYIAPQVWAWGASRIPKIAERVTRMAVILPFEVPIYQRFGLDVTFVGHPLLDRVRTRCSRDAFFEVHGLRADQPLIGLLPGSRRQEVDRLLPVMSAAVRRMEKDVPGLQVVIGAAESLPVGLIEGSVQRAEMVVRGETYELMAYADLLLVASGTATLEAAILGTPMVVLYKMAWMSYLIGKCVVHIPNIGLANIVAGRRIVPELIQRDARPEKVAATALEILQDPERNQRMRDGLAQTRRKLGESGAARRTAEMALEML